MLQELDYRDRSFKDRMMVKSFAAAVLYAELVIVRNVLMNQIKIFPISY